MKLTIINRQCNFSNISVGKQRPEWFSREKCFLSIYEEVSKSQDIDFIVFFDGEPKQDHFIKNYKVNLITESCGSGAESYKRALDLGLARNSELLYFVEDDYLHKPGWLSILREGFREGFSYFTLYDHADKYSSMYNTLTSKITVSPSCHWRSTPSTTDTFACMRETLIDDLDTHKKYSSLYNYSLDHQRFIELSRKGKIVMSSIPGYSTHVESFLMSPCINWDIV